MEIDIFGSIGDSFWEEGVTVKSIREQLKDYKDTEELTVYINSPGGSVTEGLAIYNLLAEKQPTIKVIGEASSIASVIACAGKKVLIAETALMLLHKPWTMLYGDEDDIDKTKKTLATMKQSIIKAYQSKTDLSESELDKILAEDTYHNAEKLLSLKLVDEIYKPNKQESDKLALAEKIISRQIRKFYALNTNNNHSQTEEPKMDYKVEYDKLVATNKQVEAEFAVAKSQFAEREKEFNALKIESKQMAEKLETIQKENEALAKVNEDYKTKELLNSVELDLVKLKDKIKPAENSAENNYALRQELVWLKTMDDIQTAVINGKTPYQRKIDEISARTSLDALTEPIDAKNTPQATSLATIDISTPEGIEALHIAIADRAKKDNIEYIDAYALVMKEYSND